MKEITFSIKDVMAMMNEARLAERAYIVDDLEHMVDAATVSQFGTLKECEGFRQGVATAIKLIEAGGDE